MYLLLPCTTCRWIDEQRIWFLSLLHACIYHILFLHFIIIALNLTSRINEVTLFCHIVDAVGIVC